jgi:hypothetical protein
MNILLMLYQIHKNRRILRLLVGVRSLSVLMSRCETHPLPPPSPMSCDLLMLIMGKAPEWGTFENQTWLLSHPQGMNANLGLYFTCKSQCGWVFLFVLGINWVYAYLLIGSYLFKNPDPLLTRHLKKVNTHLCLIINDLKI